MTGTLLVSVILAAPLVWHLWIQDGSANANFFFAEAVLVAVVQTFLVTDVLFAHARREFCLFNGLKEEGEETQLVYQWP